MGWSSRAPPTFSPGGSLSARQWTGLHAWVKEGVECVELGCYMANKTLGKSQYDCTTMKEQMAIEAALVHWLVRLIYVSETLRVAS